MLDDVQRRAFLVQPAGKGATPFFIAAAHGELDKGAGKLLLLPWRSAFARAQADHRIADAKRLPRLHRQIAADAITFVEEADHGDPLSHRRAARVDRDDIPLHRHDIGRGVFGRVRNLLAGDRRTGGPGVIALRHIPDADPEQGGAADRGSRDRRLHASGLHAS